MMAGKILGRRCLIPIVKNLRPGIRSKHTLPELPYKYEALEPIISRDIMALHYEKHHAAYVANLNVVEEKIKHAMEKNDFETVISLQGALKFNGGGHVNHSIFWENLAPCGGEPGDDFKKALIAAFGCVEGFKQALSLAAVGVQGSGWAWLGLNPKSKKLEIATCANQDPLKGTTGLIPIFGIDVWEHAYYLQYKNMRVDYAKAIFDVANWKDMTRRFKQATNDCP